MLSANFKADCKSYVIFAAAASGGQKIQTMGGGADWTKNREKC